MEGYNGYKNYETWNVCLWLNNDPGSQEGAREIAAAHYDEEDPENYYEAGQAIKEWMEELMPNFEGVWSDLFNSAWSEVDWDEVAEAMLEE